jgi:hypothetical protein
MISFEMDLARSTGMAKPRPMLPELGWPVGLGAVAPAVGTPTNLAAQSTSAPPLLPGLIAASVWMAETSSAVLPLSAGTSIVRSRGADDPAGHGARQPEWRAERDDRLADLHVLRGAQRDGRIRVLPAGLDHGQVRQRVATDQGGRGRDAVAEHRQGRPPTILPVTVLIGVSCPLRRSAHRRPPLDLSHGARAGGERTSPGQGDRDRL